MTALRRFNARINAHEAARQARLCAQGDHPHVLRSPGLTPVCLICRKPA